MRFKEKRFRGSVRLEIMRKVVHVLTGLVIVLGIQTRLLDTMMLGIAILFLGALMLYNYKYEREALSRILSINRADAKLPGFSALAFFVGCWVVLSLFPQHIALAAILVLTVGDPIAHLIGSGFGATRVAVTRRSYLNGAIAGTVAGALAAWLYAPWYAALLASAAAMAIEAGELRIADHHVDDNLTIPIVSAVVLFIVWLAFPYV